MAVGCEFSHVQMLSQRWGHRRSQEGPKGPFPPKCLENIVILCFESCFSTQNGVIRLKSNILAPPKIFWPPQNFWAGDPLDRGLFTIAGLMNCGISLAGRKNWFHHKILPLSSKEKERKLCQGARVFSWLTVYVSACCGVSFWCDLVF